MFTKLRAPIATVLVMSALGTRYTALGARQTEESLVSLDDADAPEHGQNGDPACDGFSVEEEASGAREKAPEVALEATSWAQFTIIQMLRCWNPQDNPKQFRYYTDHRAAVEMLRVLPNALQWDENPIRPHPAWEKKSLQSLPAGVREAAPKHQVATMLKGEGVVYQESSNCLEFPYSDTEENVYDNLGCNFFRRSFQPVQELHRCIKGVLTEDVWWNFWQLVGIEGTGGSDAALVADLKTDLMTKAGTDPKLKSAMDILAQEVENFKGCKAKWDCQHLSLDERSFEIINRVAFKDWSEFDWKHDQVKKKVMATVVFTRTAPETTSKKGGPTRTVELVLAPESVGQILGCYKLMDPAGQSDLTTTNAFVSSDAVKTKEASRCLPVMFDRAEVPGPPIQPIWRPVPSWKAQSSKPYTDKHALCGRVALAALADPFRKARYPEWYNLPVHTAQPVFSLTYCMSGAEGSCRTFAYCWAMWLEYVVGIVAEDCGPKMLAFANLTNLRPWLGTFFTDNQTVKAIKNSSREAAAAMPSQPTGGTPVQASGAARQAPAATHDQRGAKK